MTTRRGTTTRGHARLNSSAVDELGALTAGLDDVEALRRENNRVGTACAARYLILI